MLAKEPRDANRHAIYASFPDLDTYTILRNNKKKQRETI